MNPTRPSTWRVCQFRHPGNALKVFYRAITLPVKQHNTKNEAFFHTNNIQSPETDKNIRRHTNHRLIIIQKLVPHIPQRYPNNHEKAHYKAAVVS
jgi:hypothetical protein